MISKIASLVTSHSGPLSVKLFSIFSLLPSIECCSIDWSFLTNALSISIVYYKRLPSCLSGGFFKGMWLAPKKSLAMPASVILQHSEPCWGGDTTQLLFNVSFVLCCIARSPDVIYAPEITLSFPRSALYVLLCAAFRFADVTGVKKLSAWQRFIPFSSKEQACPHLGSLFRSSSC